MLEDVVEASRINFPPYLTGADRAKLFDELKRFPDNLNYYWNTPPDNVLQGDGIPGLWYVYKNEDELLERAVKGIVISNSCDIDPANVPDEHENLLFAPIGNLERVLERFRQSGKTEQQTDDYAATIRAQRVSNLFYLPHKGNELPESVVPLDDIRPQPLRSFYESKGARIFSLSQYGWWIFLIKLSIHFTRMQEAVRRMQ